MEITKEKFEAWLFRQPDNQTFSYMSNTDCLLCKFMKQTTNKVVSMAGLSMSIWDGKLPHHGNKTETPFPKWLQELTFRGHLPTTSSIGEVKAAYIKIFGNPLEVEKVDLQPATVRPFNKINV